MPDAGPSAVTKAKDPTAKSAKAGGGEASMDGKKRFEVKKVYILFGKGSQAKMLTAYSGMP